MIYTYIYICITFSCHSVALASAASHCKHAGAKQETAMRTSFYANEVRAAVRSFVYIICIFLCIHRVLLRTSNAYTVMC